MKRVFISIILSSLFLIAHSQTVVNDSTITLTIEEAKVLTKMTEDLKYTKRELEICDSIQSYQSQIIINQKSLIENQEKYYKSTVKKERKKFGMIFSGLGLVLGMLFGGLVL